MVNSVSSSGISSVQLFSAVNAFKSSEKVSTDANTLLDVSDGMDVNDDGNILKDQDLSEIRSFAKDAGEDNLSDEDIRYGLTYGRSVIADYVI